MKLVALGVNHKTAPLSLRERLAFQVDDFAVSLDALRSQAQLDEVVLLSTCNRVEVYGASASTSKNAIIDTLAKIRGLSPELLGQHCFVNWGDAAARHIFRVTASLESLVLGEPQILGQVKDAFRLAKDHGTVGVVLDRCLSTAFRGAKRVRTETAVARGGASISSVAVDLARRIFGDLAGAKVLILGAGEMARSAAQHLRTANCGQIVVVNRSQERGEALANQVQGRYLPWQDLPARLHEADIVVASTGAAGTVVDAPMVRAAMKARKWAPMFLIDIAVPRDIDSRVSDIEEAFLYDIDDLQALVAKNMGEREASTELANAVLDEELAAFLNWTRERSVGPVILALRERTRAVVDAELTRVLSRVPDLSEEQRKLLSGLSHGIVNKLLHEAQLQIRADAVQGQAGARSLADAASLLFRLSADDPDPPKRR